MFAHALPRLHRRGLIEAEGRRLKVAATMDFRAFTGYEVTTDHSDIPGGIEIIERI